MEYGKMDLEDGKADYFHEVPAEGHFYLGTQCFQCANPPCVDVCPVGATWQEPDGITVIDYDWCIGCRYCQAACPYWARRFNWEEPHLPDEEMNPNQHYLGNRPRKKGVMEKCTFCIQRSREGKLPACVEACPTGARRSGPGSGQESLGALPRPPRLGPKTPGWSRGSQSATSRPAQRLPESRCAWSCRKF